MAAAPTRGPPQLHVVGYYVGDIWAPAEWNLSRWTQIYESIRALNPDIIILHEVSTDAADYFIRLRDHTYQIYAPSSSHILYIRSKTQPIRLGSALHLSLIPPSSLSKLRIDWGTRSLDLYSLTLIPGSKADLNQSIQTLAGLIDPQIPSIVNLFVTQWGSLLVPPGPLIGLSGDQSHIWLNGFKVMSQNRAPLSMDEIYPGINVVLTNSRLKEPKGPPEAYFLLKTPSDNGDSLSGIVKHKHGCHLI